MGGQNYLYKLTDTHVHSTDNKFINMPSHDLELVVITICSAAIMTLAAVVFSRQRTAPTFVIREEAVNQVQGQMDDLMASVRDLTVTVN